VEENMTAHLGRWQINRFGHRAASHALPEWRERYSLAGACGTRANNFLIKK